MPNGDTILFNGNRFHFASDVGSEIADAVEETTEDAVADN